MGDAHLITIHRRSSDRSIDSGIAFADIVGEIIVEFFKGRDFGRIETIQPSVLDGAEAAFDLCLVM